MTITDTALNDRGREKKKRKKIFFFTETCHAMLNKYVSITCTIIKEQWTYVALPLLSQGQ